MFDLTLVDQLRQTFGHDVYRHRAHSQIAHERARRSRQLKAIEALLMGAVAAGAVAAAFGQGQAYAMASAVLAAVALTTLLLDLTCDFGRSAQVHAWCATRLWRPR